MRVRATGVAPRRAELPAASGPAIQGGPRAAVSAAAVLLHNCFPVGEGCLNLAYKSRRARLSLHARLQAGQFQKLSLNECSAVQKRGPFFLYFYSFPVTVSSA